MKINNSPWLTQLNSNRATYALETDTATDIVIVGGGIAGVTTLYYLLKNTDKNIILVEGNKLAHGATGHNAGQVVAEFEKPLVELANEHGIEKAIAGLRMVEDAWDNLNDIFETTEIDVPFIEFIGYGGYSGLDQFIADLETERLRHEHKLTSFPILISRESGWINQIPEQYKYLCTEIDASALLETLTVKDSKYSAAIPQKRGVTNSALFTERLALWCLENYPNRATISEFSFVHGIELDSAKPKIIMNKATITCEKIVLCTNGFENFYIHDRSGTAIDSKFHHLVHGAVGYMTGFTSTENTSCLANYYYEPNARRGSNPFMSDPYFYITRRPFQSDQHTGGLTTIGGPEILLEDREIYSRDFDTANRFHDESVVFLQKNFDSTNLKESFFWHGLMGYTVSGVRLVGPEPLDPRLLYNLGCNGVGILPSVMGAQKIAHHINGDEMQETIFDPKR